MQKVMMNCNKFSEAERRILIHTKAYQQKSIKIKKQNEPLTDIITGRALIHAKHVIAF